MKNIIARASCILALNVFVWAFVLIPVDGITRRPTGQILCLLAWGIYVWCGTVSFYHESAWYAPKPSSKGGRGTEGETKLKE